MRSIVLLACLSVITAIEFGQDTIEYWNRVGREGLESKLNTDVGRILAAQQKPPKNVILFIGDGMGIATLTASRIAQNQKNGNGDVNKPFYFETFPFTGLAKTASFDTHTTDSAASAVALMCGRKVEQNTLGRIPGFGNKCEFGEKAKIRDGIADLALEKGIDVGFATTASITDATPGALYAKDIHRRAEFDTAPFMNGTTCEDVASQILNHPANKFKVMMGGGHAQFQSTSVNGNRTDDRDVEVEWTRLAPMQSAKSRVLLKDGEEFAQHEPTDGQQLLGIFAPLHFPYRLDDILNNSTSTPRLAEMAVKAVQVMNKQSTSNAGYFLMIEGANIDKAQHKNRFHLAAEETREFDRAIEQVTNMVGDDTLIIVTADHAHALTIPGYLNKSHSIYERDGNVSSIFFATGPGAEGNRTLYTPEESMEPHFAQPAIFYFKDARHGGEDVGIWAKGPFAWLFSGTMENTQIAYNIKYLLCLMDNEKSVCDLKKSMDEKPADETNKPVHISTASLESQSFQVLNTNLPILGTLIALLVVTCILVLLVAVLLLLLLRSKFGGAVKPSSNSA